MKSRQFMELKQFKKLNKIKQINILKNQKGYLAIINVMIVSAVVLLMALSMIKIGNDQNQNSLIFYNAKQSYSGAYSCAEFALQFLHDNPEFDGQNSENLVDASCDYEIITTGAQTRIINAQSTAGNTTKRQTINISQVIPQIEIQSWEDTDSF